MKKLLSITLLFSFFSYGQTGRVKYKVKNTSEKREGFKVFLDEELNLMTFELRYNKEHSFFTKLKHIPKNDLYSKGAMVVVGALHNYFQYPKTKEVLVDVTVKNTPYHIDHSYKMNDWKLTNESITLNGYTCFKATRQKYNKRTEKYSTRIAWYTPQIPASYGPAGNGGLPGLILQLNYGDNIYNATEITLNPKKLEIPIIKKAEKITVDKYIKLMRAARKVTED